MEFVYMVVKLIAVLVILLAIMVVILRFTNKSISTTLDKKYIRVLEKVQLSKESFIVVVRIGSKGAVFVTSSAKTEKISDLSEEEIKEIEKAKIESIESMTQIVDKVMNKIKSKERYK